MASEAPNMPLFYQALEPLNRNRHGNMKLRRIEKVASMAKAHAIPVTIDEFVTLQRFFPIVFSVGDNPVPLALMGLHEGVNVFLDDEGKPTEGHVVLPAYMRRYPFMLARLSSQSDDLSLCFDPTSGAIGEFEGEALFVDGEATDATKTILQFCEQFEAAGQRTAAFVADLEAAGLLIDGEVSIQPEGAEKPFLYRGFRMIDEKKLLDLRGDELRKMNQNGMLPLIYAHLYSLQQIREVFARQRRMGKGPAAVPVTADA